jgi:hypothetical protein
VDAEQAIPTLVGQGEMTAVDGLVDFASEQNSKGNRVVFGPGFQKWCEPGTGGEGQDEGPLTQQVGDSEQVLDENRAAMWTNCRACDTRGCRQRPADGYKTMDFRTVGRLVEEGTLVKTREDSILLINEDALANFMPPPPGTPFNFGLEQAVKSGLHAGLAQLCIPSPNRCAPPTS